MALAELQDLLHASHPPLANPLEHRRGSAAALHAASRSHLISSAEDLQQSRHFLLEEYLVSSR